MTESMIEDHTNNRLTELFKQHEGSSKVMSLFLTAGYPDLDSTVELILGFEENGTELVELGMPFSDPLADGPTIQYSSNMAIKNGVTIPKIFEMVKQVRRQSDIPVILMGYINPVLRYGVDAFCEEAAAVGVDGLIIPDVPLEEAEIITRSAKEHKLPMIYLVAPNTSDDRMHAIDTLSEGFVYCVSVTGVTGAREGDEVAQSVKRFINRVKKNIVRNPKMVGFGIKSYDDARRIAEDMDGYIVGSALIDTIKEHYPKPGWKDKVFDFVHSLKYG